MSKRSFILLSTVALLVPASMLGCKNDEAPAAAPAPAPACSTSSAAQVDWKKGHALAADLKSALTLTDAQLCTELGSKPCVEVHRVLYGESDPFGPGLLYTGFTEPLATTPLATERLVLSACVSRVNLDATADKPLVFAGLNLKAPALPPPADPAVRAVVVELYHRLLGRDPKEQEVTTVLELASDKGVPATPKQFATLACFAIGTSNEFLFF